MVDGEGRWTDHRVEEMVGSLLRFGVLLPAVVVLLGGALYRPATAASSRTMESFLESRRTSGRSQASLGTRLH